MKLEMRLRFLVCFFFAVASSLLFNYTQIMKSAPIAAACLPLFLSQFLRVQIFSTPFRTKT